MCSDLYFLYKLVALKLSLLYQKYRFSLYHSKNVSVATAANKTELDLSTASQQISEKNDFHALVHDSSETTYLIESRFCESLYLVSCHWSSRLDGSIKILICTTSFADQAISYGVWKM